MNKPLPSSGGRIRDTATRDRGKSLYISAQDGLRLHVPRIRHARLTRHAGGVFAGTGAQAPLISMSWRRRSPLARLSGT